MKFWNNVLANCCSTLSKFETIIVSLGIDLNLSSIVNCRGSKRDNGKPSVGVGCREQCSVFIIFKYISPPHVMGRMQSI